MALLYFVAIIIHYNPYKSKHFNPHFFKTSNQSLTKKAYTTFQFNKDGIKAGQSGYFTFNRPSEITSDNDITSIALETVQINDSKGLQLKIVNKSNEIIYGNYFAPKDITVLLTIKATLYYI